jgi:uncharacterized protein YaaN involved in tellurite resistance
LTPAQIEQVKAAAAKNYAAMLKDSTVLSNFGMQSLDGVNATVSRMLREQSQLEIPEVSKLTKDMNHIVNGFRQKYNPNDPKVKKAFDAFDSWKKSLTNMFHGVRSLLDDLYEDSLSVEQSLDRSAGVLVKERMKLQKNVILCDELYEQNERAITQLIGVIAIMEQIRDDALADAERLKGQIDAIVGDTVEKRNLTEQRTSIVDFITDMEIRINEFIQRLFVAWSTSPQIRNIRKISFGLDQRIGLLIGLTIPALKMTVAVWGSLVQAEEAGKKKEEIDNLTNDALTMFAEAAATAVPKVARIIQAPSIRPETLTAMADSIVTQNEGLLEAVREGQQQRALVVDAIVTAGHRITTSGRQLNDAVVDLVTRAQKPVELLPAPEVPEAVIEYNRLAAEQ